MSRKGTGEGPPSTPGREAIPAGIGQDGGTHDGGGAGESSTMAAPIGDDGRGDDARSLQQRPKMAARKRLGAARKQRKARGHARGSRRPLQNALEATYSAAFRYRPRPE